MTEKPWPTLDRVKDLEDAIRPAPTTGKNGTVTVNRDTAQDIADTLGKVRDQINGEIDRDPKPPRRMMAAEAYREAARRIFGDMGGRECKIDVNAGNLFPLGPKDCRISPVDASPLDGGEDDGLTQHKYFASVYFDDGSATDFPGEKTG